MTRQELKRLSRLELLELLLRQMEENERLCAELKQAREQLNSRKIELENAGSIAQASLQISSIFEAAQMAADMYLENVRRMTRKKQDEKEDDSGASADSGCTGGTES